LGKKSVNQQNHEKNGKRQGKKRPKKRQAAWFEGNRRGQQDQAEKGGNRYLSGKKRQKKKNSQRPERAGGINRGKGLVSQIRREWVAKKKRKDEAGLRGQVS